MAKGESIGIIALCVAFFSLIFGLAGITGITEPNVYYNVKGTTDITTTSTNWVDFSQMEITLNKSGTFLILFLMSGLVYNPTEGNIILNFQMLINGTPVIGCVLGGKNMIQLRGIASFTTIRSLVKNDVIKIQWKVSYSGCTGYCRAQTEIAENRELTILELPQ